MSTTFRQLGLPNGIVRALSKRGINEPFPIQEATIPDALAGKDVCGKAPTGSGKTLAFGLPTLVNCDVPEKNRPSALILAPTRELAEQIKEELQPIARSEQRNVFAIYGGVGYGPQKAALRKGVDVLVATPGRLEDLMEQGAVRLNQCNIVVVDEADRMADMGFLPAVRRILDKTAKQRQTMLFSATLDGDVGVLIREYQTNPVRHETASVESEAMEARHHFWLVDHHDRTAHVADIIDKTGRAIVFTRTRRGADRLAKQLGKHNSQAVAMHGGLSQNQRKRALREFEGGRAKALIATDVAARGIHVDNVAAVVHYDPPADHKDYVHRSGRTARAGNDGDVISLVTHEQRRAVRRIQKDADVNAPFVEADLSDLENSGYKIGDKAPDRRPDFKGSVKRPTSGDQTPQNDRAEHRQERNDRPQTASPKQHTKKPQTKSDRKGATSVYVANLPWEATDRELTLMFAEHGEVYQATIIKDRKTKRPMGFGFVDMAEHDASRAVQALAGVEMGGRELTVRLKSQRS